MPYPILLEHQAKPTFSLKQTQRLMMSPQMQQAINLLQLPVLELYTLLENELQQNPIIDFPDQEEEEHSVLKKLEEENAEDPQDKDQLPEKELSFNENDFEILKKLDEEFREHFSQSNDYSSFRTTEEEKMKTYQENSVYAEVSLFDFIMFQLKESVSDPESLAMAEAIIGSFDENGFLKTSLQEMALLYNFSIKKLEKLLKKIQTFEPYGIGASNMRESLLIQLRCQQKHKTLAYKIIEKHYEDLIHNRLPMIKKSLDCSVEEISEIIKRDISRLDLHPGFGHFKHFVQYITPDAFVEVEDGILKVKINDDYLPPIRINHRYLHMLRDNETQSEIKDFIRHKLGAAKWLLHNVHQRNDTLLKIIELLTKQQKDFFLHQEGKLAPLTMKTVSEQLGLHESTIARAVANKYIETPRGILPLRAFFTYALMTKQGDNIASHTIKNSLLEIIKNEDKMHPFSDADLSKMLNEKGIICARRTVAKYRAELNLGNVQQRRKY